MTTTNLKAKLSTTADKASDAAAAALDLATEAGRMARDEVRAHAADSLHGMRAAAGERTDAVRDTLVDVGERLAETLQSEAQSADHLPSRLLNGLASGVATVTDGLRGRSLGDLLAEAQGYARRNPGVFVVGAAVAGFALARFLRASGSRARAEARAAAATDRLYRDAARRTVDTLGQNTPGHPGDRGPLA